MEPQNKKAPSLPKRMAISLPNASSMPTIIKNDLLELLNLSSSSKEKGTPKIIHFIWLDFDNKRDGVFDDSLNFFKDRIIMLHPENNGWTINCICNWAECLESIKKVKWLIDLLNNKFICGAHKSDALRYYYLYTMGGVWIDISTFLVSSVDNLVEQNKNGFTCYYMPSDILASWVMKLPSEIFETLTLKQYTNIFIPKQNKLINIKYKNFNFISENYFIISSIKNKICKNVCVQLKNFWISALPRIKSKEDNCYELNKLMVDLFKNAYTFNIDNYPYLELVESSLSKDDTFIKMKKIILEKYLDCSYFFNYIQLYLAIRDYSIKKNGNLKNLTNSKKRQDTQNRSEIKSFSTELCNNNNCDNKVIEFEDKEKNIHLLSASYNRLYKWSDSVENRISFEDTLVGNIIKQDIDPKDILKLFNELDITQIKYSSFSRNKSSSVKRLIKIFGKPTPSIIIKSPTFSNQIPKTRHSGKLK
jgi:hypothetical protein